MVIIESPAGQMSIKIKKKISTRTKPSYGCDVGTRKFGTTWFHNQGPVNLRYRDRLVLQYGTSLSRSEVPVGFGVMDLLITHDAVV